MLEVRTSRRRFLLAALATAVAICEPPLFAQTPGAGIADLRDQLEKGLRARRPEEFRFIARVVAMVEKGQLPLELVTSTFQWSRERAKHRQFPFPYFERALRLRAEQRGIKL